MKNSIYVLLFTLAAFVSPVKLFSQISQISGPFYRIPGISAPSVIQVDGFAGHQIRWWHNGGVVGGGQTFDVVEAGSYFAQVNLSTNPDHPFWVNLGSTTIWGLEHFLELTGANPINPTWNFTHLCVNSNASIYIVAQNWIRNGVDENYPGDPACRYVFIPGTYAVDVTYQFGAETSTISIPAVVIFPAPQAPAISVSGASYNPVTPPVLTATNASDFANGTVGWYLNSEPQATGVSYTAPGPGRYYCNGVWSGAVVTSVEIVIPKGSIPAPYILAHEGSVLTYYDPELQLSAQSGYNSGYTWYFNGQEISGATNPDLTVFKPGSYTVRGCAMFPDGTMECKTSEPMQITGETLFVNYVRNRKPLIENIVTPAQLDALPYSQVNINTMYGDGFARPLQQVQRAQSPAGFDMVSFFKYDALGRETKKFLPFTRITADGNYIHVPPTLSPLYNFYGRNDDKIADTAYPFAESDFEPSPLNRLRRQGAPGEDWQLNTGHVTSHLYSSNTSSDNIRIWTISTQGLASSANYAPGTLSMTETTDENNHVIRTFIDKLGRTILHEKIVEGGDRLRTYQVYDDMGRLTHILPPKTTGTLPSAGATGISNDLIRKECFTYEYDGRGRVIKKNIPGAGTTYMIYDPWDRVALTQHANQRAKNKWSFTKYDALDRPILTGEVVLAMDYPAAVQAVTNFYATVDSNPLLRYESLSGTIHGFTNHSYPVLANELQAYTVTYYDDYSFMPLFGWSYQFAPDPSIGLTENFTRNQKLVTGTKSIILGTTSYLKSVNYYDKQHRLIQVVTDNHVGGTERVSSAYDFSGKLTKERTFHISALPVIQLTVIDKEISYDHAGRILKIDHTLNGGPRITLTDNHYNELGQLIEKNIHGTAGSGFLQSLDYVYNIRGWLLQVNPSETESNVRHQDLYGFELAYNSPPAGVTDFQPSFNGNIAAFTETRPATLEASIPFKSGYSYRYDARDQITRANYSQPSNPARNSVFDMPVVTYDANGNITSLQRKGITTSGVPGLIDNLNYFYNGNQLIKVDDAADQAKGFVNK